MEKIKKIFEKIKLKWLKETSLTILLIAIIIAAFIGINIGVDALNLTDVDFSGEQLFSITDTTKEQISKIPAEEKIDVYMFDYEENSATVDLVKQYLKLHENMSMTITTTTDRPDLAKKYNIYSGNYSILILSGEKYKVYTSYDLYTTDYTTGEQVDLAEQRITNGILSVSSIGTTAQLYMLEGHEEYSTDTVMLTAKTGLEVDNYTVKNLNLLVEERVPEDCGALIICSPKKDFTEVEAEKIKNYINVGGKILWMNDPYSAADTNRNLVSLPNIQSILDLYGATLDQDGIVIEQDLSRILMQSPDFILPNFGYSPITEKIATNGMVLFSDASRIRCVDDAKLQELGVTKTELLTTSNKAIYRRDISKTSITPVEGDEVGTQLLGAMFEKSINAETSSTLIIYANNFFATDNPIIIQSQQVPAIYFYNNQDLLLNSVAYLAEAEEQLVIRKNVEYVNYTATASQNNIVMTVIFGVPVLIILVGIVVWQLRRRKK